MLVWRLNLAWKGGDPNQCLRLGNDPNTDRTLRARFRESASYGSALNGADGISDTEGKAAREAASERGQRASFNGATGMSDMAG